MAAPTVTASAIEDVQSIGAEYRENIKVVTDGVDSTFTLTVGTHTKKIFKLRLVQGNCSAIVAADGRSAAISALPLSSTTWIEAIGGCGSGT